MGEVAHHYLASLPAVEQKACQQEINGFVSWYGADRTAAVLTAPQVGSYAEQVAKAGSDPVKKLEPVRGFLIFLKKEGFTKTNLSVHLRVSSQGAKKNVSGKRHHHREALLTPQGYDELKQELEDLKNERPKMQEEIRRAAADKDVRENAPLEAAREHHGQVESRIRELEGIIESARVLGNEAQPTLLVSQGHNVTIRDLNSGETVRYMLVDPREVNPTQGKISIASPVGKTILDRGVGMVVEVAVPAGVKRYRIEKIEP